MTLNLILMAAGNSRRFGSNKLLFNWKGRPLYSYGLEALVQAARQLAEEGLLCRVQVVSQYEELLSGAKTLAEGAPLELLYSPDSVKGASHTVRAALTLGTPGDWYLFCAGDQPFLRGSTVAALAREVLASGLGLGCVRSGVDRGNPVLFKSSYVPELLALSGDRGGRSILKAHPRDLLEMEVPGDELRDVDLPSDLGDPVL